MRAFGAQHNFTQMRLGIGVRTISLGNAWHTNSMSHTVLHTRVLGVQTHSQMRYDTHPTRKHSTNGSGEKGWARQQGRRSGRAGATAERTHGMKEQRVTHQHSKQWEKRQGAAGKGCAPMFPHPSANTHTQYTHTHEDAQPASTTAWHAAWQLCMAPQGNVARGHAREAPPLCDGKSTLRICMCMRRHQAPGRCRQQPCEAGPRRTKHRAAVVTAKMSCAAGKTGKRWGAPAPHPPGAPPKRQCQQPAASSQTPDVKATQGSGSGRERSNGSAPPVQARQARPGQARAGQAAMEGANRHQLPRTSTKLVRPRGPHAARSPHGGPSLGKDAPHPVASLTVRNHAAHIHMRILRAVNRSPRRRRRGERARHSNRL